MSVRRMALHGRRRRPGRGPRGGSGRHAGRAPRPRRRVRRPGSVSYRTSNVHDPEYVAGMSDFTTKALTPETFDDFAALVDRN